MPLFVYKNNLDKTATKYLKVILKGDGLNTNAIGSKITLTSKTATYCYPIPPN